MTAQRDSVVVTGIGAASPLGGVVSMCAAARAGLMSVEEIGESALFAEDWGQAPPILGHSVRGYTEGYTGLGRVARLGMLALEDLLLYPGIQLPLGSLRIFLNLADGYYHQELSRVEDPGEPVEGAGDRPDDLRSFQDECRSDLIPVLTEHARGSLRIDGGEVCFGGHAGFVPMLQHAVEMMRRSGAPACVVGGIDSFIDPLALGPLTELGLRKWEEQPQGVIPGEAAVSILLERYDHAVARGAPVLAVLGGMCSRTEPEGRFSERRTSGRALSEAIKGAGLAEGICPRLMIGDLNGDEWRAYEWGMAQTQLPQKARVAALWLTAASLGEVGAAAGPAALSMAARALERGYAGGDSALIWLSSESGNKGAFVVRRAM